MALLTKPALRSGGCRLGFVRNAGVLTIRAPTLTAPVAPAPYVLLAQWRATTHVARVAVDEGMAPASEEPAESNRVFVSNLAWATNSDGLADHFSQAPGFLRAMVMTRDGRSRGMGLVEFDSPEAASQAISSLNGSELDGRTITAVVSQPRERSENASYDRERRPKYENNRYENRYERSDRPPREPRAPAPPGSTLYVGNLSYRTTWQELKDHFSSVAQVDFARISKSPDGKSRGFGFVQMASAGDAEEAMQALHESDLGGRNLNVRIAEARE